MPPLTKLIAALLIGTCGWALLQHPDVANAQAPASSPSEAAPLLIVPGQSVGPAQLGKTIRELLVRLGPTKGVTRLGDGTIMYRWFEPPSNTGIGVRTDQSGRVFIVSVLNDARYATKERLHVGSTEAEVVSTEGPPSRVESNSEAKVKTLIYESVGMWFSIQLDPQLNFYNTVFEIGVMARADQAQSPPAATQTAPPPPPSRPQPSPPSPASSPPPSPPPPAAAPQTPAPPRTPAPQAPPPADNRLYAVQIAVSDRDRAASIAKLLTEGMPRTTATSEIKVNTQAGFRVVSEPLPQSVAQGLIAPLAGRGIHASVEPLGGDTVQLVFGSFASRRDAEALAERVSTQGYDAWVREGTVYTLQLGPYPQSSVNAITGILKSGAPEATVITSPAP